MEKGILFSFMVLLLLSSLLSLNEVFLRAGGDSSSGLHELNAFKRVSDKFANIKNNSIVLSTNSAEKLIDERTLPVSYSVDSNRFSFTTDIPAQQERIDTYLENLNALRVFLEDTNYAREFDSMHVDINTLLPPAWGGVDSNISFLLEPQCMEFSILDLNYIEMRFVCSDNNYFSVRTQDVNITLDSSHDFNLLSCNFNGSSACFNDDFNAQNPLPYISINIDSSDCFQCGLAQTAIRGHYDPSMESNIVMSCNGAGCISPQFDANFSYGTRIRYSGPRVVARIGADLGSRVNGINFNDMNISVEDPSFGIRRWRS